MVPRSDKTDLSAFEGLDLPGRPMGSRDHNGGGNERPRGAVTLRRLSRLRSYETASREDGRLLSTTSQSL